QTMLEALFHCDYVDVLVILHRESHYLLEGFVFVGLSNINDLHSFPTRRSSDLQLFSERTKSRSSDGRHGAQLSWQLCRVCAASRDRKSTRLNSSHVSISYAVFCLKKKNNRI